jgi:DNA-binding transcriptional MerR regulator
MLRIGDFSQLAQVSVPTLRHYDELGLLKPAQVNKFTDYRYYTVEQLPRLNRILALKDLGLSLDQIRQLLKDDMPAAQLRNMLALKRAEIEEQLDRERERLARVEARLKHIEHEGDVSTYDVVLKRVDAMTIAGLNRVVQHVSDMGHVRGPTLGILYDWLRERRVNDVGPELMLYHSSEYTDENIAMEVAVVLDRPALKAIERFGNDGSETGSVTIRDLPSIGAMASTIHHGQLMAIPEAIIALFDWIGRNGFHSAGPIREVHLFGREYDIPDDAAAFEAPRVLEIQVPVDRDELTDH